MADKSFTCNLAELTCGPDPSITREEQQRIIIKYLVPWLNYYLKGRFSFSGKLNGSMIESDTSVVMDERDQSLFFKIRLGKDIIVNFYIEFYPLHNKFSTIAILQHVLKDNSFREPTAINIFNI